MTGEIIAGRGDHAALLPRGSAYMTPLQNDTFLRALMREPTPYTPIWIMRQAGRYLPEYNATRKKAGSFLGLAKNPDYCTEVTLQPLDRFKLDAAILFSDILTVPDAMGLGLYFVEGEGPKFERTVRTEEEVKKLPVADIDQLKYVTDAVTQIRGALNGRVPLIGFSGSPFTLACYMIEGGGSEDFRHVKTMLYQRPDLLHTILEKNTQSVIAYLNAQINAGAQAVMLFDTWGGALSHSAYQEFSLAYARRIMDGLKRSNDGRIVPRVFFPRVAACGWNQWPSAALMRWGSTGRSAYLMRSGASVKKSHCKAISIRMFCLAIPPQLSAKQSGYSMNLPMTKTRQGMYLISATAFHNSPIQTMWKHSLTLFTAPVLGCSQF